MNRKGTDFFRFFLFLLFTSQFYDIMISVIKMENELPKRKSPRLKNFDYHAIGAYFITICTQNRRCILSRIVGTGVPTMRKRTARFHNLYLRLNAFVTKNMAITFGKPAPTIISYTIVRITKNICGISMKILCVGITMNYTQKNRRKNAF